MDPFTVLQWIPEHLLNSADGPVNYPNSVKEGQFSE
jgi:hypothetical protein